MVGCHTYSQCNFQCDYEVAICYNSCPCFANCKQGCENCNTRFCKCYNIGSNEHYIACQKSIRSSYDKCLLACPVGSYSCFAKCVKVYHDGIEKCPCGASCPDGCPCPLFNCTTSEVVDTQDEDVEVTTNQPVTEQLKLPTNTTVLVLSRNRAVLLDADGRFDTDFDFTFGQKTIAHMSCSSVFQGQFYVFGGSTHKRQISKLVGHSLTNIGRLDFDFSMGTCASSGDTRLYLCFHRSEKSLCRYTSDPLQPFTEVVLTRYPHYEARIAASNSKVTIIDLQSQTYFQPRF